jgi:two-component system response regulator FixJ
MPMTHPPTVFIVDDDGAARRSLAALMRSMQWPQESFVSVEEYLDAFDPSRPGCLILEVQMPGIGGLGLLDMLAKEPIRPPAIVLSARIDVLTVVRAMKAGAVDFLEKPCDDVQLCTAVEEALAQDAEDRRRWRRARNVHRRIDRLTPGQRDVLQLVVRGESNKVMAQRLGMSVRAIEARRAKIMQTMKAQSLAELIRMTLQADAILP